MQVLAALGDAPTAAIAVVAIVLGVLLAARGPREKRAADVPDESEATPTLLKVPISAPPEKEPGFVGPKGEVVGHGPIRLGAAGPLSVGAPAEPAPPAALAPDPVAPRACAGSRAARRAAATGAGRAQGPGVARRRARRELRGALPPGHDQARRQARRQVGRVERKRARRRGTPTGS